MDEISRSVQLSQGSTSPKKIKGYLSKSHRGTYIFSRWKPEIKFIGSQKVLHQAERHGQVDAYWFGLDREMCEYSVQEQGITLEPLESVRCYFCLELIEGW